MRLRRSNTDPPSNSRSLERPYLIHIARTGKEHTYSRRLPKTLQRDKPGTPQRRLNLRRSNKDPPSNTHSLGRPCAVHIAPKGNSSSLLSLGLNMPQRYTQHSSTNLFLQMSKNISRRDKKHIQTIVPLPCSSDKIQRDMPYMKARSPKNGSPPRSFDTLSIRLRTARGSSELTPRRNLMKVSSRGPSHPPLPSTYTAIYVRSFGPPKSLHHRKACKGCTSPRVSK